MQALHKKEILEESSKPSKLFGKPTIASLPLGLLQLSMHPRVGEPDGMKSKRSPLDYVTRKWEAPKEEFLRRLSPWEGLRRELEHPLTLIPPLNGQCQEGIEVREFSSVVDRLVITLGHPKPPALRIGGCFERGSLSSFSTPLSKAIMEAPHPKKVKMQTIDPFDRTTDLNDHLDVYKA